MKKVLVAVLAGCFSTVLHAQSWYGGVQYSRVNAELVSGVVTADSNPSAINLSFGKGINKNFAVEGLVGFGVRDDKVENSNFDLELKTVVGVMAVGTLPVAENTSVYGKLGVAKIKYDDSDGDSSDGTGALFGVGMAFDINEKYGLNFEYLVYPDAEYDDFDIDVEAKALNLGAYLKF